MYKIKTRNLGVKVVSTEYISGANEYEEAEDFTRRLVTSLMADFDFTIECIAPKTYVVTARNVYYGSFQILKHKKNGG